MGKVFDLINQRIQGQLSLMQSGTSVAIFIAGPIDEDYDPKIRNHHWEVATLQDLVVLGLAINLDECEVADAHLREIDDCHGGLTLNTDGIENTLGVLLVFFEQGANVWSPLTVNTLGSGQYLPFAVTFIGRDSSKKNVITQWHEDLLKFVYPVTLS